MPGSKSQGRFVQYSNAKTIQEFFDLHPGPRSQANMDLCNDIEHGLIRIASAALLHSLEGCPAVAPLPADTPLEWRGDVLYNAWTGERLPMDPTAEPAPTKARAGFLHHLVALPELVSMPDFLDRLTVAAEAGLQEALAVEARLAGVDPSLAAARALEALEGDVARPALAGDPSVLDMYMEEAMQQFTQLFHLDGDAHDKEGDWKHIADAEKSPEWEGTGGWKERTQEELFRCIETHKALELRSQSQVDALVLKHGRDKVHRQKLVLVFKQKWLAKNVKDRKKVRLTVGDLKVRGKVENTYAPTVAFDSTRLLIQLGVLRGARRTTKDVGGAYLFGKPTPPAEPGGRFLIVPVPPGFGQFGKYPEKDEHGRQNYFEVVGNLPGRQDAGRIWGECYDEFLLTELKEKIGVAFKQSIVDRRIYYMVRGDEYIFTGIYVDDNLFVHSGGALWDEFEKAWSERFREPANAPTTALDEFCGLLMEDLDDGSTAVSAPHVMQSLADALAPHARPHVDCSTPLAGDALRKLPEEPIESNPLMPEEYTVIAQQLTGIAGWICGAYRFDAYLAFVAVAQHASTNLTKRVWEAILRWCHYLLATKDTRLHFRKVDPSTPFTAAADSSCLNGPLPGSSYGGFCLGFPGSGAFMIRCLVPSKLADSSAGAEAIIACHCVKAVAAMRMLCEELDLKQLGPTPVAMDAQAVLDGTTMDRVSRASRWMAARLAILRQMVANSITRLVKVPTGTHIPDIFTKPITDPRHHGLLSGGLIGHP